MILRGPWTPASGTPALEPASVQPPAAARDTLVVRVSVCGVCRTDLDVVTGRVAPRYPVVPGHQVVGRVEAAGDGPFRAGDRVGIAWIHSACGTCRWCRAGQENLCPDFESTGCDVDGGYAEFAAVPAAFAHRIPDELTDAEAAPLLCAGAIGWRSLRLARVTNGEPLGLSGFGASGHLVLQLARHRYPDSPVYVFARSETERAFARELGAAWSGDFTDAPPAPAAAIVDTTPAWRPVVESLAHLAPGGRLVVNAIRKAADDRNELLRLDYATHLWMEREIKTVANVTRADVREVLTAAVQFGVRPAVSEMPLATAALALANIHDGTGMRGAVVLRVSG